MKRVLCLGGWGSAPAAWDPLARALPDAAIEAIPWWSCLTSEERFAERLMGAGERPALLVGWSLGAIALLRVVLSPAGESLPAALLLSGSARLTAADAYEGADPRALRAMRMRLSREPSAVLAEFAARCALPEVAASEFASRYVGQFGAPPGVLEEGLDFLQQTDLRERLGRWAVKVRWLHGECDAVIPVQSARYAAARAPNIQLEVLSGCGHALPWTAVGEVARHVRGLLYGRIPD